jgi:hypothetical protein
MINKWPYGFLRLLLISRLNQEGQRGSNEKGKSHQTHKFSYPGSLCVVTKPFGEGHKGRVLSFEQLRNLTLLDKTLNPNSSLQSILTWTVHLIPWSTLSLFRQLVITQMAHFTFFIIFLLFVVLLLHLGKHLYLKCCPPEPRNIWSTPTTHR